MRMFQRKGSEKKNESKETKHDRASDDTFQLYLRQKPIKAY